MKVRNGDKLVDAWYVFTSTDSLNPHEWYGAIGTESGIEYPYVATSLAQDGSVALMLPDREPWNRTFSTG